MDEPLSSDEEIAAAHVGPPDVLDAPITLAAYDPAWPRLFEREATRIRVALRDRALLIRPRELRLGRALLAAHDVERVAGLGPAALGRIGTLRVEGAWNAATVKREHERARLRVLRAE